MSKLKSVVPSRVVDRGRRMALPASRRPSGRAALPDAAGTPMPPAPPTKTITSSASPLLRSMTSNFGPA